MFDEQSVDHLLSLTKPNPPRELEPGEVFFGDRLPQPKHVDIIIDGKHFDGVLTHVDAPKWPFGEGKETSMVTAAMILYGSLGDSDGSNKEIG